MPARIKPKAKRRRHFIKQWRQYRGLTLEQLAERIGSTKANISKIENLQQAYTQDFLEAAAEALMCDPEDLIMRLPGQNSMWTLWERAKPAERGTITDLAEALLKRRTQ